MNVFVLLDNYYLDFILKRIKWRILYCRSYVHERKKWIQQHKYKENIDK